MNKRKLKIELLITRLAERSSFCGNLRNFCRGLKKTTFNQSEISLQKLFKGRRVFFSKLRLLFTHLRCRKTNVLKQPSRVWAGFLFVFTSLVLILTEAFYSFFPISTSSPSVCVFLLFFIPTAVKERSKKDKKKSSNSILFFNRCCTNGTLHGANYCMHTDL